LRKITGILDLTKGISSKRGRGEEEGEREGGKREGRGREGGRRGE
jgi:hypothetical protein